MSDPIINFFFLKKKHFLENDPTGKTKTRKITRFWHCPHGMVYTKEAIHKNPTCMQHAIIGSTNIHSRNIQKPKLSPYNSLRLPTLYKALKLKEIKNIQKLFFSKTEWKQNIAEKITDSALFALVTEPLKNKKKEKKKDRQKFLPNK